ncbi:MAG: lipopolysaccharide assembly protein LapA domain-containing protein [Pseudomonadota bacterium]|nr:lipopolysaccharide assembly protein LapA domain-containing protein [Pseudomonadota bacterium]
MQVVRWIVGLLLFLLLLFLALQNSDAVELRFYHWWTWKGPLIFVILVAFALGAAAGLLTGAVRTARLRRQLSRLRRDQGRFMPAAAPTDGLRGAAPGTVVPPGPYGSRQRPIDGA